MQELRAIAADMERLHAAGELLAMSERNAVLHRRILDISGHGVARAICSRLHSQIVRFQFRAVPASGRSAQSLDEHKAIVEAIAAGDRAAAERAMRRHLRHVGKALLQVASAHLAA